MSLVVPSLLLLFLLVSMFAAAKVGERRRIQDERERPGEANDIATMEAAILGLMGLLLAFTFTPDMAENMVDSVHEMFAADTERLAVLKHPAQVSVFALLGFLAIVSAGFSGYAVGAQPGKHWPHLLAFIVVTVMTIYLIVDMQYPRHGLVQVTDTIELYDTLLKALQ